MATPITKPTYETHYRINKAGQRIAYRVLVREPPVINSYDDAVAHNLFKGDQFEGTWKGGVFSGLGYELIQAENLYKFRLKSGYGTIFGRQYAIESDYDIDLSSLTGKNYCVVYAEINLNYVTKSYFSIKLAHAGAGYPDIPTDDLVVRKQGVARMPLYRFIYKASGSDRFTAVTCIFYRYGDGVAERARIMDSNGVWNGRVLSNLFYYNADRFMKGNKAQYADLAKSIGSSGKWAAFDDEMAIKASGESARRDLLMAPNGVYRVTGRDKKDNIDVNKRFLVENKKYTFGYSRGTANPVPPDGQVVGVIVQGWINVWKWHGGFDNKWRFESGCDMHMSAQRERSTTWYNFVALKESQRMFRPSLWYSQTELYIDFIQKIDDYLIVQTGKNTGIILNDASQKYWCDRHGTEKLSDVIIPKTEANSRVRYGNEPANYHTNDNYVGKIKFINANGKQPEVEVEICDDYCIECELTFRPLYIRGTEKWVDYYDDCWSVIKQPNPNPFSSLSPSLEGGQT